MSSASVSSIEGHGRVLRAPKRLTRRVLGRYAPRLLYPTPATSLAPERLYAYLDALWHRRHVSGAVLEVGCWLGGTSAIASKLLQRTGFPRRYVAVDTFSGFIPGQFEHDLQHGTPPQHLTTFDRSSLLMVRRLLDHWGSTDVELVQGDIVTMSDEVLPSQVAVCLVDVDLEIPVYHSLLRIFPRLVEGGLILVDDCPEKTSWAGARVGYRRFVTEAGLTERYFMGMGVVEKPNFESAETSLIQD